MRWFHGESPATSPATLSRLPGGLRWGKDAALQREPGPRWAPARPPADPLSAPAETDPPPLPRARSRPAPSTQPGSDPPPEVPVAAARPRGDWPGSYCGCRSVTIDGKGSSERRGAENPGVSEQREFWKRTLMLPDVQGTMGKVVQRSPAAGLQFPGCPWRSQRGGGGGLFGLKGGLVGWCICVGSVI